MTTVISTYVKLFPLPLASGCLITAPKNDSDVGSDHRHHTRFGNVDKTFFGWGSVEHKFLINSKLYALLDILECGADAFITDTDIGFRKDPRGYFDVVGSRGDIVAQNDTNPTNYELNINSGFMYWKRTPDNLDLIKDILTGEWVMLCLLMIHFRLFDWYSNLIP